MLMSLRYPDLNNMPIKISSLEKEMNHLLERRSFLQTKHQFFYSRLTSIQNLESV